MNKEPIALYIFRFFVGFGLFAYMGMLYWSSSILEEDVKRLQREVRKIENALYDVKELVDESREEIIEKINEQPQVVGIPSISQKENEKKGDENSSENIGSHSYTNLLEEDPFYKTVLPKLLGKGFRPKGTRLSSIVGKQEHLHPFSNWSTVSRWNAMCNVSVAEQKFGLYETLSPAMALRMENRTIPPSNKEEFWIFLRDDLYWEPLNPDHLPESITLAPHFLRKHQVTAHDFKFYYDAIMNPNVQESSAAALRNYLEDIVEFRVIDDFTFAVRWAKENGQVKYAAKGLTGGLQPLPRFVYQYFSDGTKIIDEEGDPDIYRKDSVWAQNFAEHWSRNIIVSCGPWLFDGMTDEAIRFRRNPNFYNPLANLIDKMEIRFKESPDAIWQGFKNGNADLHTVSPDQLGELDTFLKSAEYAEQQKNGEGITRLDYVSRSYAYIGWNQKTPYFNTKKVRQAMTMAIDRKRIINQNLNGMGIELTGPFHPYSPSSDKTIQAWPYDPDQAARLLEEEGWYDSDGSGTRDKEIDGKRIPFQFYLTYYVKNPTSKANSEYIATALREVGIDCILNGVDITDLSKQYEEKSFDAIYLGWALGSPPEEPKQLWHSSEADEKGSSNGVGFKNKEADELIEQLQYEYDINKRIALYHRFHKIIHEEAPYTFLYTPKAALLHRDYVKNVWIPAERQDLIPGANVAEPNSNIFWLKR